jgi:hypothetical protein
MNCDLVSSQPHELWYLARQHDTTIECVKEVIRETGSRSLAEIEAALDKQFKHVQRRPAKRVPKDRAE